MREPQIGLMCADEDKDWMVCELRVGDSIRQDPSAAHVAALIPVRSSTAGG